MKVLVVGDMHGQSFFAKIVIETAEAEAVDEIWQVGDFGFWPNDRGSNIFLKLMNTAPVPVYFVDGNHERHDLLVHDMNEPYNPLKDLRNIWHVPRGCVRFLDDANETTVLHIGGAVSVDRYYRTLGHSWFEEEVPTRDQLGKATTAGRCDIVLSHDAPGCAKLNLTPGIWPEELTDMSQILRYAMSNILINVKPKLWFCGHYHQSTYTKFDDTEIHVLNCDGAFGSMMILDTDTYESEIIQAQQPRI